jgi:hypothetical protein
MYAAAWGYAYFRDPWMTPRFTPSMMVFWGVQQVHHATTAFLLIPLLVLIQVPISRRHKTTLIAASFCYLLTSLVCF